MFAQFNIPDGVKIGYVVVTALVTLSTLLALGLGGQKKSFIWILPGLIVGGTGQVEQRPIMKLTWTLNTLMMWMLGVYVLGLQYPFDNYNAAFVIVFAATIVSGLISGNPRKGEVRW